jgi:hypothetical protein
MVESMAGSFGVGVAAVGCRAVQPVPSLVIAPDIIGP